MKDSELLTQVADKLKKRKITISTAESCTGGLVSNTLTNIAGSSEYFKCGVVSYSNKSKIELIGVSDKTLKKYGAVSAQTAKEMALGIKDISKTDIGISTTGIAGPSGGTDEKPVGLVYIGLAIKNKVHTKKFIFHGNRIEIKRKSCEQVLKLINEYM